MKSRRAKEVERLKEELERIKDNKKRLAAIKPEEKPYFLWHLYFMDVFDNGGFDIVIGNPPYIQLQSMGSDADDLQKANYDTYTRTGDIYCLFYEQGNNLLKDEGVLTYITSNNWMRTKYGELLRKYFVEKTNPIKLLNFEDTRIFQSATVETNILVSRKQNNENKLAALAIKPDYQIGGAIASYFNSNHIIIDELTSDDWVILSKKDFEVKQIISQVGTKIKELPLVIYRGVTTGLSEAFFIDESTKDELINSNNSSSEIIKPLLRGRDIKRFATLNNDGQYLIFTRKGIDINRYPAVKAYLKKFYEKLKPKEKGDKVGRKPGDYKWYEVQDNTAYYPEFEKDKIVWLVLSDKPQFALDVHKYYTSDSTFIMTGENLKFLCAILNSKVSEWYFDKIAPSSGMGTNMWKKYKIEKLPIAEVKSDEIRKKFEILLDYLIFLNDETKPQVNPYTENSKLAPVIEDVLNMMVYELYFEQHMKEEEIDVLKFVDTEKLFKDISDIKDDEEKKEIIGKVYSKLQEQENPIRNRIISSNIKSTDIIRRINSTTH
jgi:hypothetical protein